MYSRREMLGAAAIGAAAVLQIVATTHSPYLLDYVEADEVLLTSLGDDGYAAVKPLTEHPDYERWKDVMAPGEFWSTVGERWITEQPHK